MRVINNLRSGIVVDGVSIPGGQHRNVRGFDPDSERNQARMNAGDISVPALEDALQPQVSPEPSEDDDEPDADDDGRSWFSGRL